MAKIPVIFTSKILSGLAILVLTACDEDEVDQRRLTKRYSSDLEVQAGPEMRIYLPDRSEVQTKDPETLALINSVYLKITPAGLRCQDQNTLEILDAYRDNEAIVFSTQKFCDYQVELFIGQTDPKKLDQQENQKQITSIVNYTDDIKPIIQKHCLSCHPNYLSYEGLTSQFDELVFQVENQLMPPSEPLDTISIARFLAWQANDYAATNPQLPEADSRLANISKIYYRNNLNTIVFEYMLLNINHFIYEDSLWLQADGEAEGIETIELLILEPLQAKR